MDALLLFPHQLFQSNAHLARGKVVLLVEDALYFRQYAFHKQKLMLHRATMRMHETFLRAAGVQVVYIAAAEAPDMATVIERVRALGAQTLHYIDPIDDWLERRLLRESARGDVILQWHATPMFLSSVEQLEEFFSGNRMFMGSFYPHQRKHFGVLVQNNEPVGGKWSFDTENRKRFPKALQPPLVQVPKPNAHVREAATYVKHTFAGNPGDCADFGYPVTYADARAWLTDFIETRLRQFGDYEDAIVADESTLFHSVLTPLLNIGLLTPREVLDEVLGASDIPLNSLEGFVRQLIGWREFMRASYIRLGRRQRTANFWNHQRRLPQAFWTGETGVLPLDTVIRRVLKHAYAHHIERLMVLANFMQLCGFHPDDVYRWFMELFIDAYDWVMVPNVYGMALHADGGLITTKPYISGSNYILKMSNFPRGDWCEVWDGLFWSFIASNREFFARNVRIGPLVGQIDRMGPAKLAGHQAAAAKFLAGL